MHSRPGNRGFLNVICYVFVCYVIIILIMIIIIMVMIMAGPPALFFGSRPGPLALDHHDHDHDHDDDDDDHDQDDDDYVVTT